MPIRSCLSSTTESPASWDPTAAERATWQTRCAGCWVNRARSSCEAPACRMSFFPERSFESPMGFASVAITLDNSDHKLAIDYDEVTVTRRVYRSGESEYRINGSACRLKDINELFYDTGIGKEGYSIIGQGQIDKILSGKPEERQGTLRRGGGYRKVQAPQSHRPEEAGRRAARIWSASTTSSRSSTRQLRLLWRNSRRRQEIYLQKKRRAERSWMSICSSWKRKRADRAGSCGRKAGHFPSGI